MPYTEAQRRATDKYQKTLSNISIRMNKEEFARIKSAVEKSGIPLRQFVLSAINEKIERDNLN